MDWLKEGPNGEKFDTSGPLRVVPQNDNLFVTGMGLLIDVQSIHEGNQLIRDLRDGNSTIRELDNDSNYSNDRSITHYVRTVDRPLSFMRIR